MTTAVLITGCNGGIGTSLVQVFSEAGYHVVGVDKKPCEGEFEGAKFLQYDIGELTLDAELLERFAKDVREACSGYSLHTLVNNAAVQILGGCATLEINDFVISMNVNVIAPFVLVKTFLSELRASKGVVVNIGSVHAQATKPEFAAYATSKSALHGLTRALAVDLGPEVRVNAIAPAATATDMLMAGFEGQEDAFNELCDVHPLRRIAEPVEVANLALFMASKNSGFLTGATLYADGGILSRLHDPL